MEEQYKSCKRLIAFKMQIKIAQRVFSYHVLKKKEQLFYQLSKC